MKQSPCPDCGNNEHYILTSREANKFGATGQVVKKVKCANCGKTTSV